MKTLRIALAQNSAGANARANLDRIAELLANVRGLDLIVLPEIFSFRGGDADYRKAAEPLPGTAVTRMSEFAAARNCWILCGSVIEKEGDRIFDTSVLLDRRGRIAATYRKMHLFEAEFDDGSRVREANVFYAGDSPAMADIEGWKAGLAVCFDLRFPELFRRYAAEGAVLLLAPSNFTRETGKDHWEILVRARAIENRCFVAAPNQCGSNPATGTASYGNSMIVGPWGEVIRRAADEETVLVADLDPTSVERARMRIAEPRSRAGAGSR